MPPFKIAPSLLASDLSCLASECQQVLEAGADYLHLDVMDGHFVPNLTLGPPVIAALCKNVDAFIDCHLMVSNPEQWVKPCADAGVSLFNFHIEAVDPASVLHLIDTIKSHNMKVGVAIKPTTPVSEIVGYCGTIDMVLVMTVDPGFGGQPFRPECLHKVSMLRKEFPDLDIQVDGGISLETLSRAAEAGANVFVAGSAVFGSDSPSDTISEMKKRLRALLTPV